MIESTPKSEPESERHFGRAEHAGDGEHAYVDAGERDDQVAPAVTVEIHRGQQRGGNDVDDGERQGGGGHRFLPVVEGVVSM